MTLGMGLFIMLDQHSHPALPVVFQITAGVGAWFAMTTLVPAAQAALSERDTASSTTVWSFVRSFGTAWDVAVPVAVFNSRADALARNNRITDPAARALVAEGRAYSHATGALLRTLPAATRQQVVGVFNESLRAVWVVAVAITGLSFFVVFVEKEIGLTDELDTEYGLRGSEKKATDVQHVEVSETREQSKAVQESI
ncbi:Major facilitator superfamily domain- general substrate transporter [Apiospora phragmitis]|uniref:Major facilitator superfamily domain- general substrate transporter n=1 Tax=Apiospora phragmitis TaxID=2905665 RepID=A0ABR1UK56_9PEZI